MRGVPDTFTRGNSKWWQFEWGWSVKGHINGCDSSGRDLHVDVGPRDGLTLVFGGITAVGASGGLEAAASSQTSHRLPPPSQPPSAFAPFDVITPSLKTILRGVRLDERKKAREITLSDMKGRRHLIGSSSLGFS